jgi:metallo-beta-lactamase family protein
VLIGYQAEGTNGRRIVDGAKTMRLFGEEIAVRAHIHTLGGFSAHADQKELLEWLSHFRNPDLLVIVNHGEEKTSVGPAEKIEQVFHFKTIVPRPGEKRTLFGPEESEISEGIAPEEEKKELFPQGEPLSVLARHLDRNYKRLRRKIRRELSRERHLQDPHWLKQIEEINEKVRELGEE